VNKKFKTVAITIPFLLFMFGEPQAHPLTEILRGEDEPRPLELFVSPAVKPDSAQKPPTAKVVKENKNSSARRRPRGLAKKAKGQWGRKAGRNSAASVAARRLYIIRREYVRRTRRHLVVTSYRRTPAGQARAIRNNIRRHGIANVMSLYGNRAAIREIAKAYRANRRNPQKAQKQMAIVIQKQMARGIYVSGHLRGLAADIRSRGRNGARLSVLRDVAQEVGGKVLVEADHYHLQLV
jgi:hypothetical protein